MCGHDFHLVGGSMKSSFRFKKMGCLGRKWFVLFQYLIKELRCIVAWCSPIIMSLSKTVEQQPEGRRTLYMKDCRKYGKSDSALALVPV